MSTHLGFAILQCFLWWLHLRLAMSVAAPVSWHSHLNIFKSTGKQQWNKKMGSKGLRENLCGFGSSAAPLFKLLAAITPLVSALCWPPHRGLTLFFWDGDCWAWHSTHTCTHLPGRSKWWRSEPPPSVLLHPRTPHGGVWRELIFILSAHRVPPQQLLPWDLQPQCSPRAWQWAESQPGFWGLAFSFSCRSN